MGEGLSWERRIGSGQAISNHLWALGWQLTLESDPRTFARRPLHVERHGLRVPLKYKLVMLFAPQRHPEWAGPEQRRKEAS